MVMDINVRRPGTGTALLCVGDSQGVRSASMTDMRRTTWYALGALVVGLLAGAWLASSAATSVERVVGVLEPIGTLWVNAVRMTIIPLVVSMLIAAIASADSIRSLGRLGGAALRSEERRVGEEGRSRW